ncbi:MAG: hypothetical protein WCF35_19565, partial [Pseudolabrys sp.]
IYKEENTLEMWKQDRIGKFALLKSYPICKFSGKLGPKIVQGDYQAPGWGHWSTFRASPIMGGRGFKVLSSFLQSPL